MFSNRIKRRNSTNMKRWERQISELTRVNTRIFLKVRFPRCLIQSAAPGRKRTSPMLKL